MRYSLYHYEEIDPAEFIEHIYYDGVLAEGHISKAGPLLMVNIGIRYPTKTAASSTFHAFDVSDAFRPRHATFVASEQGAGRLYNVGSAYVTSITEVAANEVFCFTMLYLLRTP